MHQRAFLGGGWTRGGASEVVRRAHPASGAQWNVQVVKGKVNGKCLWNACKALSLGLLLMVLGAAMATIGYYADHLSVAQEVRGNHTVRIKNESRGFHLNNLSYAGPIVMGVGGFIVVAACVMTFEARDSAAKVVPARLKIGTGANNPSGGSCRSTSGHPHPHVHALFQGHHHGSLKTSGSQTGSIHRHSGQYGRSGGATDRRLITESFQHFSKSLALKTAVQANTLKCPQGLINKSPSAPNLAAEHFKTSQESASTVANVECVQRPKHHKQYPTSALLSAGMLNRHALSVDETAAGYRVSQDSLQDNGSQDSLALDLHLDCPVTLRIHDRRRRPLMRQRHVEAEEHHSGQGSENPSRRSSHSCSPRLPKQHIRDIKTGSGGSSKRRHSNASDSTGMHPKTVKWEHSVTKGKLERAISSDSRLVGGVTKIHHRHHHEGGYPHGVAGRHTGGSSSDTDIRRSSHTVVHFCTK